MRLLFAGLAVLLAACAPRLQPPGEATATPTLAADKMIMADGGSLPLRAWLPAGEPKAVILALHGFNDYSLAFEEPARAWTASGLAVYAYDQRGFGATAYRGLWPGEERLVDDLRTAAALLTDRYPDKPLYILGESMGGAVVMSAAASGAPPPAHGLILVAPAVWGRQAQGPVQSGALWLAAHTVPWMRLTGDGLKVMPSDNFDMLRKLARDPLVIKGARVDALWGLTNLMDRAYDAAPRLPANALVMYGSQEDVIPADAVLAMLRRLPGDEPARPRVALYRFGYHMLLRDRRAHYALADIAAWIADPEAPLPSGADRLAEDALDGDADGLEPDEAMLDAPGS